MKTEILNNSPLYKFLLATFRANPDYFIEKLLKSGFLDIEKDFKNIITSIARNHVELWMMPQFNNEVITSFEDTAKLKWKSISNENISSPFEFLKRYVEEILIFQKDMPYYKISKSNTWNALTFEMGEDLFVATLLADNNVKHGVNPDHFQWNYILHSSFFSLNSLIQREKLIENHYHLYGSSPNVDLSWICLMNNPFGQEEKFKTFQKEYALEQTNINTNAFFQQTDLYVLIKIAAYIRIRLFEECCLEYNPNKWNLIYVINKIGEIRETGTLIYKSYMSEMISVYKLLSSYREENRHVVDYAITDFNKRNDLNYLEITGERHFHYCCLKRIFRYDRKSFEIQVLFYIYLLIKGKFGGIFIQRNNKYGFDNFQRYQNTKLDIISKTIYQKIAVKMALKYNISENHIEKLEARIAPDSKADALKNNINKSDKAAMVVKNIFFYVLHFIKNKNSDWGTDNNDNLFIPVCRESKLRAKIKEQAKAIEKLRKETRDESFRIYGIDAASHEVNCRPENFGQVFRFLSSLRQNYPYLHYHKNKVQLPDLQKTYHVGEDFYDIIDGLRSIDEAILFLGLKHGDRIGHGVALGIDPEKYYKNRKIISMPLQNALDNVAWCLYCIEKCKINISTSLYTQLKFSFDRYFNILHNNSSLQYNEHPSDLLMYIYSWKLRGDNPDCYIEQLQSDQNCCKTSSNKQEILQYNLNALTEWEKYNFIDREKYNKIETNVYNLYHCYHFDFDFKKEAQKNVEIVIDDDYIQLAKKIQLIMRNFVLKKGVAIESNPSSNFLISNLDNTIDLPIFKLFPVIESENDFVRLNTSVNTDDQGVFYTSLVKEYSLIANALQREYSSDGMRKYSDDTILTWIDHLIDNGKRQCFMQRKNQ
jgi:adenosine deaminase